MPRRRVTQQMKAEKAQFPCSELLHDMFSVSYALKSHVVTFACSHFRTFLFSEKMRLPSTSGRLRGLGSSHKRFGGCISHASQLRILISHALSYHPLSFLGS